MRSAGRPSAASAASTSALVTPSTNSTAPTTTVPTYPALPIAICPKSLGTPDDVRRADPDPSLARSTRSIERPTSTPTTACETSWIHVAKRSSGPAIESPLGGLFYVGCDAGGRGVGTQQAIDSGYHVAEAVYRHHHLRKATAA